METVDSEILNSELRTPSGPDGPMAIKLIRPIGCDGRFVQVRSNRTHRRKIRGGKTERSDFVAASYCGETMAFDTRSLKNWALASFTNSTSNLLDLAFSNDDDKLDIDFSEDNDPADSAILTTNNLTNNAIGPGLILRPL